MHEQTVHPIVRYGGPVLGAIILYFVLSSMIGNFRTDLEEAQSAPVVVVDEVGAVEEGGEAVVAESPTAEEAVTLDEAVDEGVAPEAEADVAAPDQDVVTADETVADTAIATAEDDAPSSAVMATDEALAADGEEAAPAASATEEAAPAPVIEIATVEIGIDSESPAAAETPTPVLADGETEVPAVVVIEPDPATPASLAEMTPEQIYAGLPDAIATFFPDQANPGLGEELALTSGCTACHSLQEGVVQVGPSWYDVGERAATRVAGQSPALYLYTSITQPNLHIVEGFQPNLMPLVYDETLSDEQLANIVAYLLTLRGDE